MVMVSVNGMLPMLDGGLALNARMALDGRNEERDFMEITKCSDFREINNKCLTEVSDSVSGLKRPIDIGCFSDDRLGPVNSQLSI